MKRFSLVVTVLLVSLVFATALAGAEELSIRLSIDWAADSGRGQAIQRILDEFEKDNPGIKVKLLGGSQDTQNLLTQIVSGDAPEVIQVAYRNVKGLANYGAWQDLTDRFGDNSDLYYEQLWDLAMSNGRLYGYPWLGHTIQLVYNKTAFEEVGLTRAPETWEELYEYAKKLTRDTDGDGKIDQWGLGLVGRQHHDITWLFNMFATQAGAELVKIQDGKPRVAINSEEGLEALEFYVQLVQEVCPPDTELKTGGEVMADFRNGIVAMEFQGPWGITDIWQSGNPFEVAAAATPAGTSGRGADVGPYMLCIPEGITGEKLEAAYKLIEFLGSTKGQELIMLGEKGSDGNFYPFRVPIRKDMAGSEFFQKNPEFLIFIEGLAYPSISTPVEAWAQVEVEVYQSQLNQAVLGKITPAQALANIERLGNVILNQ